MTNSRAVAWRFASIVLATTSIIGLLATTAYAAPETGKLWRFGASGTTWQEPLRLQKTTSGAVDLSVANYKGLLVSAERQSRFKWGEKTVGFGILGGAGSGQASGGGTSDQFVYSRGNIAWSAFVVEPRAFYALSERIDVAAGIAGIFRLVDWPETDSIKVTPFRSFNPVFFLEIDLQLTQKLGFRQSLGVSSADAGPFMIWGLTYDL